MMLLKNHCFTNALVLALTLITLNGCKTDELNSPNPTTDMSKTTSIICSPYYISEEDANNNATLFIEDINSSGAYNINLSEINSVENVTASTLIPFMTELDIETSFLDSEENVLYIFNYDGGCAIAAADKRLNDEVFAFLPNINLSAEDLVHRNSVTIEPGEAYMINDNLETTTAYPTIQRMAIPDQGSLPYSSVCLIMYSVALQFNSTFNEERYEPDYIHGPWEDYSTDTLSSHTPLYHQGSPFNDLTPVHLGNHTPAGCGPIALLIAYVYNYNDGSDSVYYNNLSASKSKLKDYNLYPEVHPILSKWARKFGRRAGTVYTYWSSMTPFWQLVNVLNSTPYYSNAQIGAFNPQSIRLQIHQDKPVIMQGWNSGNGHYFIVEGIKTQQRTAYHVQVPDSHITEERHVIKCNMGDHREADWYVFPGLHSSPNDHQTLHYHNNTRILTYNHNQ